MEHTYNKIAADGLREAAKLISGGHWVRRTLVDGYGFDRKYCAIGAIESIQEDTALQMTMKKALREFAGDSIADWNDHQVSDARQVSRAMIKAAKKLESTL